MAFAVNGLCLATQAEAVNALNLQFPVVTDAFFHTGSAVAYGTTQAILTTWTFNIGASGGTWVTHAMIFSFADCVPDPAIEAAAKLLNATPTQILSVFGFGFGAVVLFWFLGFVIAAAISAINKT